MKEEDKLKRRNSILKTKEKRKEQTCKVFEIKIDSSHLSIEKSNYLKRLFLEAKWYYNFILASEDIFKFDDKQVKISVLNKDKKEEEREIKFLSSQMRQGIKGKCIDAIKSLSTKKKKGKAKEVGRLKFKSQCNSISLNQFNSTYRIENKKYIFIQGFKKHFKVIGLDQIPERPEFANAKLIQKPSGYYLKITCFFPKVKKEQTHKSIGLDFGIKDSIVTSDGEKYNFQFSETKQIKKASRQFNKAKKGTVKRKKAYKKLTVAYEKLTNQKKDVKNKFVSKLVNENDLVVIQNENLKSWHASKMKGFGRRVQFSIMGGIKTGLRIHPETLMINRFFPSTQLCPNCGSLNKHGLEERIYNCDCGYFCDRDIHSAKNILYEGLKILGRESIKMLDEKKTSAFKNSFLSVSDYSMTQEAKGL